MIEVRTFRLRHGADEAAFLDADRRQQAECLPFSAGFLRRTTARGDDGGWIVLTLWASVHAAAAGRSCTDHLAAFLDAGTDRTDHYETLD